MGIQNKCGITKLVTNNQYRCILKRVHFNPEPDQCTINNEWLCIPCSDLWSLYRYRCIKFSNADSEPTGSNGEPDIGIDLYWFYPAVIIDQCYITNNTEHH